ncbi:5194_t:CDS:2 [Paraglomus brasilianum]|uniref:Calcium-transporting ATPase n=1 Tax=Paraglomus brasilianum TaxID=144538 RepID=A0A9N9BL85_9GLOM|nr:5194_t:CDS:2 [Paraglomus brasilianum]
MTNITPSDKYAKLSVEQTISSLATDGKSGLASKEARARLDLNGHNEFQTENAELVYIKYMKQFTENPLIVLLLASAAVSLVMGNKDDAFSVLLAVFIVTTVAFVQEYRSEKSLEELNRLVPHFCNIMRDGRALTINANQLVPGDLVLFGVGDRVPADIRLVTAVDLEIDESNFTGETKPRKKNIDVMMNNGLELDIQNRKNIAFMGTLVTNGYGTGIVVGTGKATEFGAVFLMMEEVEKSKTPLQINMDQLGKLLSYFSFAIIAVIILIGIFQGRPWLEMFTIGVSLAVAAIPEGLPIVVTVTLALGVLRMAKRNAIVKKLPAVETLGSVNVICSDKTGTLTENKMTVTKIFTLDKGMIFDLEHTIPTLTSSAMKVALRIGNLCNNARIDDEGKKTGHATEIALLEAALRFFSADERLSYERVEEIPFNSEQKWMSVTCCRHDSQDKLLYFKGSIEAVLERSVRYFVSETNKPVLDINAKEIVMQHVNAMSSHGLRVLGLAYGNKINELVFVGFVAMHDPPRQGVDKSISELVKGGVKVVMITGDSDGTALSIARRLGIPLNASRSSCLTGHDIESMSDKQLEEVIGSISVFSRTTPRHKLAIVRAFQAKGAIVAMTGDGVNDAPALKKADIGISMGKSGTDVSREAADMILVDDDFSTILAAVKEGKAIYYNIQNFLTFQLSTSVAALTLITLSTMSGLPNPLNPMQILWINILMDGPPAQSLGVEPVDHDVMNKPPKKKNAPILTQRLIKRVLTAAACVVAGTLFIYMTEMRDGSVTARDTTMTFTTFVFFDMFNALACRSEKKSIFEKGFFSNRMFNYAVAGSIIGQLLVIYTPFLQRIFQTEAIGLYDLFKLVILTSSVFWVDEAKKYFKEQKSKHILDYKV